MFKRRTKTSGRTTLCLFFVSLLFLSPPSKAHQGERHSNTKETNVSKKAQTLSSSKLDKIKKNYESKVQPIFKISCIDCHGNSSDLPWYYSIPGVHSLMNSDMAEAKQHLDMRKGFPFKGHGTVKEDLEAIKKTVQENSMPPFRYKTMHWSSFLSNQESKIVIDWVNNSLDLLGDK
jgi:hypothetical protein